MVLGASPSKLVCARSPVKPRKGRNCRKEIAGLLGEQNSRGRERGIILALVGQFAGFGIAGDHADPVRILIGYQHPALGGIEGEMAGDFAAAVAAPLEGEFAVGCDGEGDHEVVVAVGDVGEAGAAVEDDVAAALGAAVSGGGERDGRLHGVEGSVAAVPVEGLDGGAHFKDDVGDAAVGMEAEGARAGAGEGLPVVGMVGRELGGGGVEVIDVDAVESEVVDEEVAVVGRWGDAVGVGSGLAGEVWVRGRGTGSARRAG